jgi:hypothetical protein
VALFFFLKRIPVKTPVRVFASLVFLLAVLSFWVLTEYAYLRVVTRSGDLATTWVSVDDSVR